MAVPMDKATESRTELGQSSLLSTQEESTPDTREVGSICWCVERDAPREVKPFRKLRLIYAATLS
jgi:hypothetical protein